MEDHFCSFGGLNWVEMRNPENSPTRFVLPLLLLLTFVGLGLSTGAGMRPESPVVVDRDPAGSSGSVSPISDDGYDYAMRWQEVDRLRGEDKYAAAALRRAVFL